MKKFIINYSRDKINIVEVDCEKINLADDLSIRWLKNNEWKAKINKPDFLYEKDVLNKLVKPIWYWHAFYSSVEDCYISLHETIYNSLLKIKTKSFFKENNNLSVFDFDKEALRKEVDEFISEIQIIYLKE